MSIKCNTKTLVVSDHASNRRPFALKLSVFTCKAYSPFIKSEFT